MYIYKYHNIRSGWNLLKYLRAGYRVSYPYYCVHVYLYNMGI